MQQRASDSITATAVTLFAMALLLLWLLLAELRVSLADMEPNRWPPVDSSEIVFGGQYVRLGDMPLPASSPSHGQPSAHEAANDGTALADAGPASETSPQLSASDTPSAMAIEKKTAASNPGPTKEQLAEQQRIKQQQQQQAKSRQISAGVKNSFTNKSASSAATPGSPNGNADSGALSGTPGYSLKGRTPEAWGDTHSTLAGSITIRVRVDRQGHVVGTPTYVGGSGPAAASSGVRQACIAAARQSRFSVDLDAPAEQVGTITWTFK